MEVEAFFWRRRHHSFGGGGVHRNRLYWSMDGFFWHHLQQNWKKSWRCQKNYHRDFWIWPSQSTRAFCTGVLAFLFELFWHHLHLSWKKNWRWHQKNLEVVSNLCQIMKVGGGGVSRNRLYWSINAWIHTSRAFHLHRLQLEIVYIDPLNKRYDFPQSLANGHITLNTPVLVRSLKLSSVEPSQYLDGWPPGNTGCCWQSFFVIIFKICNFFFGGGVDILTRLEYPTFFSTYVKHDRYFWLRLRKKLRVCGTLLYIASKKYMCTLIYATWDFIASMKNMCTLLFAS